MNNRNEKSTKPTAETVFNYANRFARRNEKAGRGTRYPTVRQAAKRFRVTQSSIVDIVEGSDIDGAYFELAVALGIPGVGNASLEGGDQMIEAYRE